MKISTLRFIFTCWKSFFLNKLSNFQSPRWTISVKKVRHIGNFKKLQSMGLTLYSRRLISLFGTKEELLYNVRSVLAQDYGWYHLKQGLLRKYQIWILNNMHYPGLSSKHIVNVTSTRNTKELGRCYHQCLCSPPKSTLLRAINNGQVRWFPGLRWELVPKYLPLSTVIDKGHMIRTR